MGLNHHECLYNHQHNYEYGTLLWYYQLIEHQKSTAFGIEGWLANNHTDVPSLVSFAGHSSSSTGNSSIKTI